MTQPSRILWFAVFAAVLLLPSRSAAQLVYAGSPDANAVFVIDPGTSAVLTMIPTTFSPGAIAVTPDGQFAYVAANCSPADRSAGTAGTVSVIDLVKNVVLTPPIAVGVCPNGIAIGTTANGVRVYVSNGGNGGSISPGSVSVIDPTNNVVTTINVGNMIAGSGDSVKTSGVVLTPDASRLLVTGYFTNGEPVLTIDTATNGFTSLPGGYSSFIFTLDFGVEAQCTRGLLAYVPSGLKAYVPDTECDVIYDVVNSGVVDPFTGIPGPGIGNTFGVNLSGVNAIAISPDGLRGYVSGGILGSNSKATATASLGAGGSVASVSITYGGNGYAAPPAVTFVSQDAVTPPGFAPATGVATVLNRAVSSVTVTNGGSGYGNPPLVVFGSAGVGVFSTANDSSLPSIGLAAVGAQGIAVAEPANTPLNAVHLSFENIVQVVGNVTMAGSTTASYLGSNCPPAPGGFQFGNPPVCYHISSTATFSGSALVCITDPSIMSGSKLFHYQNGWTDITNVPVTPPMICGTTNSFSPFAILQPTAQTSTTSTSISTTNVTYGTPASATVSVSSSSGTVSGNVTFSVDGGAASSMALTGGSATFNLGTLSAGNHSLAATFAAQGSFEGSSANSVLVVTPAPLTINANNRGKTYGQAVTFAGTEFTTSGLLNADNVSSVTLTSAGAAGTAGVAGSPYPITPSAAVGSGLGNYNISYVNGAMTVIPALLTISANSTSKILDAPNPSPLPWTASGFVNGQNSSVLTANPTCTTTATTASPVGSYPITCSGAAAANYTFTYVAGALRILYATAIGHVIQPPIKADGTSVLKQGRTIPAKFDVYDANGVPISTPGVVASFFLTAIVSGTVTTTVEDVVDTNNPDTAFRWDGQGWIFNITTGNLYAGSTYIYTITLNDGSTVTFQYGLR